MLIGLRALSAEHYPSQWPNWKGFFWFSLPSPFYFEWHDRSLLQFYWRKAALSGPAAPGGGPSCPVVTFTQCSPHQTQTAPFRPPVRDSSEWSAKWQKLASHSGQHGHDGSDRRGPYCTWRFTTSWSVPRTIRHGPDILFQNILIESWFPYVSTNPNSH